MIVHKIFKGFVSNDFENPSLIPINNSDINFLELQPVYNDVGGIILNCLFGGWRQPFLGS